MQKASTKYFIYESQKFQKCYIVWYKQTIPQIWLLKELWSNYVVSRTFYSIEINLLALSCGQT